MPGDCFGDEDLRSLASPYPFFRGPLRTSRGKRLVVVEGRHRGIGISEIDDVHRPLSELLGLGRRKVDSLVFAGYCDGQTVEMLCKLLPRLEAGGIEGVVSVDVFARVKQSVAVEILVDRLPCQGRMERSVEVEFVPHDSLWRKHIEGARTCGRCTARQER